MYKARYIKHTLKFKVPSATSRGVLTEKDTYYIILDDINKSYSPGIGECSTIKGLSPDARDNYEQKLKEVCEDISAHIADNGQELMHWPSIRFGIEAALKDAEGEGKRILFPSAFTEGKEGIPINGLIWMGDVDYMRQQIKDKLDSGFKCIKIKIGNENFENEVKLLAEMRKTFSPQSLEIRLDVNGAFNSDEAMDKLDILSEYNIHSIEQPIKKGQWTEMEILCRDSPIPIALDEELIGLYEMHDMDMLVSYVRPQYLIFKPSLLGGFTATQEWIEIAKKYEVDWWVTSMLESNIGLNAIAQWVFTLDNKMPQGLGTGQLYTNNIPSPLIVENAKLWYKQGSWDINMIA
jgi:o-succinylbenzoate synthase